jgi:hypothetical protein
MIVREFFGLQGQTQHAETYFGFVYNNKEMEEPILVL